MTHDGSLLQQLQQLQGWPLVDALDDGIRPVGPGDECFYCRQKIGQPHGKECVVVTKVVAMSVEGAGLRGVWTTAEPYFWTGDQCEFHKNESSWCASNLLREQDKIVWHEGSWELLVAMSESAVCLCGLIRFKFLTVVDETPRRLLRSETSRASNANAVRWS